MNDDFILVKDKKKNFFIINPAKYSSNRNIWIKYFGNTHVLIDACSTKQPEIINMLVKDGAMIYYNEDIYYKLFANKINKEYLHVIDCSLNTTDSHIQSLNDPAINTVVIDTVDGLRKYHAMKPHLDICICISLSEDTYISGCTMEELDEICRYAKENEITISTLTIQCVDVKEIVNCISRLETAAERVKNYGIEIKRMIMTGEGVQFLPTELETIDSQVCETIRGLSDNYQFFLDGSKFFTSQLYTIYTHIIGKKKRVDPVTKEVRYLYYTDNGVYCSFYNAVKVTKEPIEPICIPTHGDLKEGKFISTIFGPTCDSIDCLGDKFELPEMEIGDWFKFENHGYKCSSYSTNFNGFEDPDVIIM